MSAADLPTKLTTLIASATQQYSLKNYSAAAEFFSEAAELQDQINGEMSPENADLLYQYGRCLYHVAVSISDVLGGKVASAEEPRRKKRKVATAEGSGNGSKEGEGKAEGQKEGSSVPAKPFFQITGDENWTDSEDDEDDAEATADADAEEEEDDFAIAYEILDVARILLLKKLDVLHSSHPSSEGKGKGKDAAENPEIRQLKERLADTHDLQAEISLENERFADAITDTRSSLALKLELYPEESSLIAEAHFKLSLALEFASVTSSSTTGDSTATTDGDDTKAAQIDENMRAEAASEMEKAISSCQLRIAKEEEALLASTSTTSSTSSSSTTTIEDRKRSIADVKDMVADMSQRLQDLRNPAVSLNASNVLGGGARDALGGSEEMRGMLGVLLGASKGEQAKIVQEATEKANDLSGLVKHKKKPKAEANGVSEGEGKGKRKAEGGGETDGAGSNGKRAKIEEAA